MAYQGRWQQGFLSDGRAAAASLGSAKILVSGGAEFCADARREFQRQGEDLLIAEARGPDLTREFLEHEEPAAILVEDRALTEGNFALRQKRLAMAARLALLAEFAPVVWIGAPEQGAGISSALPPGAVEFVPRAPLCVAAAVTLMERRLRVTRGSSPERVHPRAASVAEFTLDGRDFGEVLRHELNNPLTGILGNAELLLLEVRRGNVQVAAHNLQRLEVIAELAVRMRETVRQLSDRWEGLGGKPPAEKSPTEEKTTLSVTGRR
ncbi:MAG TPA: histidine kinase dimerization/phospho-acceptor domain-containing protein [Candidatus Eisenbacteria bacterium]|nr:histidine kinase dimerization/phospho-acceptor domain-containing protein [Candidatus Eisenbacteria bacterium]